jgi:ribosomal protein L16 Arg81 hydroxylase
VEVERRAGITREQFVRDYLAHRRPLVVTDAMASWDLGRFSPDALVRAFGDEEAQVYDDLFALQSVSTLREYVRNHLNKPASAPRSRAYVRWYTKLKDVDFAWADHVFERFRDAWDMPYFFPDSAMVVPPSRGPINPAESRFPYKGLFVSGRGARTRLHRDPWNSDALLCQLYGKKSISMYGPEDSARLVRGQDFVDLSNPEQPRAAHDERVEPLFTTTLAPGEIIYFPGGTFHDVASVTDSVSITWNFLHASNLTQFCEHVARHPDENELEIVRFFLKSSLPPRAAAQDIVRTVHAEHASA